MGRGYGDAAICGEGHTVLTERLDRMLSFDDETGVLRAEAGVSLADILTTFVPRGWFLPVTPGTKFCSLGGCLAADVHGKNHHVDGAFSQHVTSARIIPADGAERIISPDKNSDLFWATAGGMGLTGFITEVSLKLKKIETSWMAVKHTPTKDLDQTLDFLAIDDAENPYSVAWIDCLATGEKLGRSVVMNGRHAAIGEIPLRENNKLDGSFSKQKPMPFYLPSFVLNKFTVKAFNSLFNLRQGSRGEFVTKFDPYFYPLDGIKNWGRMYGKKGFVQHQCVLPHESARDGLRAILELVTESGRASFLAVLKKFGPEGRGMLSFPTGGYTLALDFANKPGLDEFHDRLDGIVLNAGGRVYLVKDSRMKADSLPYMYPRLDEFRKVLRQYDPSGKFASDLSRRLNIAGD
jgi:FAD/FMN-containing dehydrogenase